MTSRLPTTVASAVGGRGTISIRRARPADGRAIARLEALAERRLPTGPILLAEVDGSSSPPRPRAAGRRSPTRSG